jgi:hypothetical protein
MLILVNDFFLVDLINNPPFFSLSPSQPVKKIIGLKKMYFPENVNPIRFPKTCNNLQPFPDFPQFFANTASS